MVHVAGKAITFLGVGSSEPANYSLKDRDLKGVTVGDISKF